MAAVSIAKDQDGFKVVVAVSKEEAGGDKGSALSTLTAARSAIRIEITKITNAAGADVQIAVLTAAKTEALKLPG